MVDKIGGLGRVVVAMDRFSLVIFRLKQVLKSQMMVLEQIGGIILKPLRINYSEHTRRQDKASRVPMMNFIEI